MENPYRGSGTYHLDIEEDVTKTYQITENGRKVQFHKGKNGRRIITDLGRDKADLDRAFALLGKNALRFDDEELIEDTDKSVTKSVTKAQKSVTNDKSVTPNEQKSVTRNCIVCGTDISYKAPQTKTCSPACRMKASRM